MSEKKTIPETPISDNNRDFIRKFVDDATSVLGFFSTDGDDVDTAIAINAEKDPKIQEYLFVQSIAAIRSEIGHINRHFKWCEKRDKYSSKEAIDAYHELKEIDKEVNSILSKYDELHSIYNNRNDFYVRVRQLFIDAIIKTKPSQFTYYKETDAIQRTVSNGTSNVSWFVIYLENATVVFAGDDNLCSSISNTNLSHPSSTIYGYVSETNTYGYGAVHLEIDDEMKSLLKTVVEDEKRIQTLNDRAEQLYKDLFKDWCFEYEYPYEAWTYYQEHKKDYIEEFKNNVITRSICDIHAPYGWIELIRPDKNHYRFKICYQSLCNSGYINWNLHFNKQTIIDTDEIHWYDDKYDFISEAISEFTTISYRWQDCLEHVRKEIEVERLYNHLSEALAASAKLTNEIDDKQSCLNSLKESIGIRKYNLKKLEEEIWRKTCERDELDTDCCRLRQYAQLNSCELEPMLIEEKKAFEAIPRIYARYETPMRLFAQYRQTILKMTRDFRKRERELETSREQMREEAKLREETCELRNKLREQELESKQAQFDKDCEAYELESTKWKSQQESKFAKYQKQINEYESLKAKVASQQSEIQRLKNELSKVTKERDRLKITIETITEYRK